MKLHRISPHVEALKTWLGINVTVWLVDEGDGVVLVDGGIPMFAKPIEKALAGRPLKRIVLTHGHLDHTGVVAELAARWKVPVWIHAAERPYAEGRVPYPTRKKPEAFLPLDLATDLPAKDGILSDIGSLTPYFAPGHSPGHVVYLHKQDNVLIAGDLFWSHRRRLEVPLFTPDEELAWRSAEVVPQLRPAVLDVCHGWPVVNPAEDWPRLKAKWRARLDSKKSRA
jgi:glyoxylase-like metal-dependent hydrolase (beta-lactamase superfamily II)